MNRLLELPWSEGHLDMHNCNIRAIPIVVIHVLNVVVVFACVCIAFQGFKDCQ